ncbi:MAG: alkene reductase [Lutibacter sp.]|uniref:alkene reductase n=1 Tax=Lutibacter sp. TaxID=1925666 RepID=UPI00181235E1|nr:alkene reductase [Lutibacter sp.]MBT8316653.1 alkene reductase [Lutibacter sp.]NNJ57513.1 alkene reductase [Lutibacter sp.]
MKTKQPLLTPYQMGDLTLKNRLIIAPMTRSRCNNSDHTPTELQATYYKQRASAGLIISEGSQVSKRAVGYVNTPGIYSETQVKGWKKVTDEVHKENGSIFIQLWHVGRVSHPDFHDGELPLAPSALNPNSKSFTPQGFKDTVTPKEMTLEDIETTIQEFKNAAINSKKAGFDGLEIHSSNGYLFHQFFNNCSNKRTDSYGGCIENRARFFFEVLDEIIKVFPENRIGVRFNPSMHNLHGIDIDEETIPLFEYVMEKLNNYNLAYVHLSEPFTDVSNVEYAVKNIAKHFRPIYKGTLIINSNFDQEKGNKIIEDNLADLVAYGKLFISNPDLPKRFSENLPLTKWDSETFYSDSGEKGYTDYPNYNK